MAIFIEEKRAFATEGLRLRYQIKTNVKMLEIHALLLLSRSWYNTTSLKTEESQRPTGYIFNLQLNPDTFNGLE